MQQVVIKKKQEKKNNLHNENASNKLNENTGNDADHIQNEDNKMSSQNNEIINNNKNDTNVEEKGNVNDDFVNDNFIYYDSNIDDIYDKSDEEKERQLQKGENNKGYVVEPDDDDDDNNNDNNNNDNNNNNNMNSYEERQNTPINASLNIVNNIINNQYDNVNIIENQSDISQPPMPNINFSSLLNSVQNHMANNDINEEQPNDKFEGVPDEVKERYTNWVENSHIFSGQMIKICRNKRPLSNAYVGSNASKDNISYSNFLPFLWKKNMSSLNVEYDLEITDELLNAFDFHVLEFIKKSIKNNEDYKSEKFKYPNLSLCEELFEEMEQNKDN
ncbi:hypothetical protein PFLG_02980 [Plasmodium falciparum RAJ116]|uniref:Uncharacterized protein n=1 Tax=Plasmodium falciparum RAJ116 TaxID=580058 RepID=A0A0L0D0C7_PLAFA|nr:hypothetical protein PFLG_02980 [Plasmodium falciparum RAJ116]